MPASHTTSVGFGPYSVRIFTSIEANPNSALVGNPREVAIVSGSAKNARYSLILRVELDRRPGTLGRLSSAIGDAGGQIGAVDILEQHERSTLREVTVDCDSVEQGNAIAQVVDDVDGIRLVERA